MAPAMIAALLDLLEMGPTTGELVVTFTEFWPSQPPPRPRYQPSVAIAGVESASAATPAKAIMRIFIFSLSNGRRKRRIPPNFVRMNTSSYNCDGPKSLYRTCSIGVNCLPHCKARSEERRVGKE